MGAAGFAATGPVLDAFLAATALVHGLTMISRD